MPPELESARPDGIRAWLAEQDRAALEHAVAQRADESGGPGSATTLHTSAG